MLARKILVTIMVLNVILAMFVFGTNTVAAKEIDSGNSPSISNETIDNSRQCLTTDVEDITLLDQEVTMLLLAIAQGSDVFESFEEELGSYHDALSDVSKTSGDGLNTHNGTEGIVTDLELVPEESYAFQIGELQVLYIPITGGTGDSFYAIQFDESLEIVGTMEGIFTLNEARNILFHFQINNQTIADLIITESGEVLGGHLFDLEGNELDLQGQVSNGIPEWWDCMNSCLSWSGVPLYLINGFALLCAAACIITAGVACGACVAAALGAFAAVGAFCLIECEDEQW